MALSNIFIFGVVLAISGYYFSIYMKGKECPLHDRIDGKTVLITGANTGIGLETAVELATRGGSIHMACRDQTKCESARKVVLERAKVDPSLVVTHSLDLASLKSILSFSQSFKDQIKKLDVLINNAGVMMCPYLETEDGFEMQIGVNHLGHFLLTNQLLDLVKAAPSSRIIIVSSAANRYGKIHTEDINLRGDKYGRMSAYSQSKFANALHAKALSRRLKDDGVAVVSLHPGVVATELAREFPSWVQAVLRWSTFLVVKTPKEGAQTQICCAVDPDLIKSTGAYFSDCSPSTSTNSEIKNETLSEWLWEESDSLINAKLLNL